jgi:hypothetical protein
MWITNGLKHAWFEKNSNGTALIAPPELISLK